MSTIARSKFAARHASTAALIAPADVPEMIANGLRAPFGRIDATAFRTPTWYAPRAPAPGRISALRIRSVTRHGSRLGRTRHGEDLHRIGPPCHTLLIATRE